MYAFLMACAVCLAVYEIRKQINESAREAMAEREVDDFPTREDLKEQRRLQVEEWRRAYKKKPVVVEDVDFNQIRREELRLACLSVKPVVERPQAYSWD